MVSLSRTGCLTLSLVMYQVKLKCILHQGRISYKLTSYDITTVKVRYLLDTLLALYKIVANKFRDQSSIFALYIVLILLRKV